MKGQMNIQEYLYDFSVDGGAVSTIDLSAKNGRSVLPEGAVVSRVIAKVEEDFTSDGLATVSIGNGDDVETFLAATAFGSFTEGVCFDYQTPLHIDDATTGQFVVDVAVADLTAGKMVIMVEYWLPAIVL